MHSSFGHMLDCVAREPKKPTLKVLVVCHGNINRSVLCAAVLRQERPDWEVREAALKGWDNPNFRAERATAKMRDAALLRGYDLSQHRSRSITIADMEWAERVIFMDQGNYRRLEAIQAAWHGLSRCWVSLGSFNDPPLGRIPDPNFMKRGSPEFQAVVDVIIACSREAAHKLIAVPF